MKKILFLGECMVELRLSTSNALSQSFAGDVYNSAVYLKRAFPNVHTSFVTAIGSDALSNNMQHTVTLEQIETQMMFVHPDKAPGIYLIETDDEGERSFTYWRNDSAAKKVMDFIGEAEQATLEKADMFMFSGISLAVIEENSRDKFWTVLQNLKDAGVQIVFDPNYRPKLWDSPAKAKEQFDKAFALSDIALPGIEDFEVLYDLSSAEQVIKHCSSLGVSEIIVKNGPQSVFSFVDSKQEEHTIIAVDNVVDTTSAGDAFNGAYLGSRLNNINIADSINLGATAAGTVIQHKGAIIPKQNFNHAMTEKIAELNNKRQDNV